MAIPTRLPTEEETQALRKHLAPAPALNLAEAVAVIKNLRAGGVTDAIELNMRAEVSVSALDNALRAAGVQSSTLEKKS